MNEESDEQRSGRGSAEDQGSFSGWISGSDAGGRRGVTGDLQEEAYAEVDNPGGGVDLVPYLLHGALGAGSRERAGSPDVGHRREEAGGEEVGACDVDAEPDAEKVLNSEHPSIVERPSVTPSGSSAHFTRGACRSGMLTPMADLRSRGKRFRDDLSGAKGKADAPIVETFNALLADTKEKTPNDTVVAKIEPLEGVVDVVTIVALTGQMHAALPGPRPGIPRTSR